MPTADREGLREVLGRCAYVALCRDKQLEGWRTAGADWDRREEWGDVHGSSVDLALEIADAAIATLAPILAQLEAALRPFAEYARLSEEAGPDWGEGEIGEFIHDGLRRSIRTQDLRAARTALAAGQDKTGGGKP